MLLISTAAAGDRRVQSRPFKVDIPFAFEVGNEQLPSGSYWLEFITTGDESLQLIRCFVPRLMLLTSTARARFKNSRRIRQRLLSARRFCRSRLTGLPSGECSYAFRRVTRAPQLDPRSSWTPGKRRLQILVGIVTGRAR